MREDDAHQLAQILPSYLPTDGKANNFRPSVELSIPEVGSQNEPPLFRISMRGGYPAHLRHALAVTGAPPAAGICCVRWGPFSMEGEHGLLEPGNVHQLSEEEISSALEDASEFYAAGHMNDVIGKET